MRFLFDFINGRKNIQEEGMTKCLACMETDDLASWQGAWGLALRDEIRRGWGLGCECQTQKSRSNHIGRLKVFRQTCAQSRSFEKKIFYGFPKITSHSLFLTYSKSQDHPLCPRNHVKYPRHGLLVSDSQVDISAFHRALLRDRVPHLPVSSQLKTSPIWNQEGTKTTWTLE